MFKSCCQKKYKEIKTPLAKARGLGSAKNGYKHWWAQRLTAIALIPLSLWLMFNIKYLFAPSLSEAKIWLLEPLNSVGVLLFIFASFYHALLGLEVVIEDYAPCKFSKMVALIFVKLLFIAMAVTAIWAVVKVNFG